MQVTAIVAELTAIANLLNSYVVGKANPHNGSIIFIATPRIDLLGYWTKEGWKLVLNQHAWPQYSENELYCRVVTWHRGLVNKCASDNKTFSRATTSVDFASWWHKFASGHLYSNKKQGHGTVRSLLCNVNVCVWTNWRTWTYLYQLT